MKNSASFPARPPRIAAIAAAAALLTVHFALLFASSLRKSATVDESVHLPAGCHYWKTGDFTLSDLNPPLAKLISCAPVLFMGVSVPPAPPAAERTAGCFWDYGKTFERLNAARYDSLLLASRVPVMLLSVLAGLLLFAWAKEVYGPLAALLALAVYCFEPNVLAHGRLATQDTAMTLAVLLVAWLLCRVLRKGGWRRLGLLGASLGAACLVKFSGLVMVPVIVAALIVCALRGRAFRFDLRVPGGSRIREGLGRNLYHALVILVVTGCIALIVVNLPYLVVGRAGRADLAKCESERMRALAGTAASPALALLPGDYVRGLDRQFLSVEQGETVNYLNGQWSQRGWWYYYLEAMALKMPIPAMLLIAAGAASVFLIRAGNRESALVALLTASVFFVSHAFGSNKQIGLRYMLPVFPLLFLLAGRSVWWLDYLRGKGLSLVKTCVLLGLVAWMIVASLLIFPDYLAYFNAIAGGPAGGPRYLLDSNIDWGQDLEGLARFLRRRGLDEPVHLAYFGEIDPGRYGIRVEPWTRHIRGTVAVSVNYLYGMPYGGYRAGAFAWLRQHEPVAVIGHTIYVYQVDTVIWQ